jgi:hypothetical protein
MYVCQPASNGVKTTGEISVKLQKSMQCPQLIDWTPYLEKVLWIGGIAPPF